MITINNVALPEINPDWLKSHCGPVSGRQPIEVLLNSQPPTEERFRGPGCNHNFDRMIYPPGGYMDWHTNGDWPGRRMYAAWSENGQSGMLWFQDGKTIIDWDKPGWNVRTFLCPVWHAVFSKCWRVSVGWQLDLPPSEVSSS